MNTRIEKMGYYIDMIMKIKYNRPKRKRGPIPPEAEAAIINILKKIRIVEYAPIATPLNDAEIRWGFLSKKEYKKDRDMYAFAWVYDTAVGKELGFFGGCDGTIHRAIYLQFREAHPIDLHNFIYNVAKRYLGVP